MLHGIFGILINGDELFINILGTSAILYLYYSK